MYPALEVTRRGVREGPYTAGPSGCASAEGSGRRSGCRWSRSGARR